MAKRSVTSQNDLQILVINDERLPTVPADHYKHLTGSPSVPPNDEDVPAGGQLPIPGIVIRDYDRVGCSEIYRFMPITQADYVSHDDHSIYLSRLHDLPPLPLFRKKYHCIGSHLGWLVVHEPSSYPSSLHLLNPISGGKLPLPPLTNLSSGYLGLNSNTKHHKSTVRAVLSFTRSSIDGWLSCFVVLVNYTKKTKAVPFCKIGDTCWGFIESSDGRIRYQDMTRCNGRFYLVDSNASLYTCDDLLDNSIIPKTTKIASAASWMEKPERHHRNFLAELNGELLMISHYYGFSFKMYKLDSRVDYWYELKSLGEYALFIGCNQAMTISTSKAKGLKGSYIYFIQKTSGRICIAYNDGKRDRGQFLSFKDVGLDGMWFTPLQWSFKEVGGVSDHLLRYDDGTSTNDHDKNRRKINKIKMHVIQKLRDFFHFKFS